MAHIFERAGFGIAPFTFKSVEEKLFVVPGAAPRAGGSCDYCSTSIRWAHWIVSADGNRFKVGSECVKKTGDKGLIRIVNAEISKRKKANDQARVEAALEHLAEKEEALTSKPHPKGWEGKTLLDYVNWMMDHAGLTGKLQVARIIERA